MGSNKAVVGDSKRVLLPHLSRLLVCLAALAIVAVSWLQPWSVLAAVKDQIVGTFSVAYLCMFASGVLVGSFFIPVIMAFAPHMFMDMSHSDRQDWRSRQGDMPSSHDYEPVWAEKGSMGGVVWTAPGSRWGDSDTLVGPFPPATQGKNAKFLKWTVFVRDGFLIMRQDNRNEARANAEGLHRTVPMDCRVPLAGARVDLLPDATKDKSPWLRKAPMRLIFSGARDPYAEDSFVLFAATSAEKEQWHLALTWAAHFFEPAPVAPGLHTIGLQAQDLYSRFSVYVRSMSPVILPLAISQDSATLQATNSISNSGHLQHSGSAGDDLTMARVGPQNRGWFGRLRRRPRVTAVSAPGAATHAAHAQQRRPLNTPQVVGDFIQDKQWGGQPNQGSKSGHKSLDNGSRVSKGVLTAARSPSASNLTHLAAMPSLQQVSSTGHLEPHSPVSASTNGYAMLSQGGDSMAPDCGDMLAAGNYSKHAHSQHSQYSQHSQQIPPGEHSGQLAGDMQSANGNGAGDSGSMHGHPDPRAQGAGHPVHPASGINAAMHAGHGVGQLAGLHAVNLFLTRCGFDLLRSQKFYDSLRKRLTVRLANIAVPNFITPLRLDGMELGTTIPMIKSAYALPSPSKTLVPRLVLDIVYRGSFKLIVQTSMHLKESTADLNFSTAFDAASSVDNGGTTTDAAAFSQDLNGTAPDGTNILPLNLAPHEFDAAALDALQRGFDTQDMGGQSVGGSGHSAADSTASGAPPVLTPAGGAKKGGNGSASSSMSLGTGEGGSVPKKPGFAARMYRSTKNIMTGGVKRVVDSIVDSVARTSVTVEVVFTQFDGPIIVWLAPPPSNRMWISFLQPPKIKVSAKPLNVNAMVQYTAMGVKLSSWLEGKLKQSLTKNMVFPACTDIKLPFLLNEEDLESIAMPLDLPTVPLDRESSPGTLSPPMRGGPGAGPPGGGPRGSASSLSSIDIPSSDPNNTAVNGSGSLGGDKDKQTRGGQAKTQPKLQRKTGSKKERVKNSLTKPSLSPSAASSSQRSAAPSGATAVTATSTAVSAAVSAATPRIADVANASTSAAARRPLMRVFTQTIPRFLRRGSNTQPVVNIPGVASTAQLITAPSTTDPDTAPSSAPAALHAPAGRTISGGSFSRASTTNTSTLSSASDPSLPDRTSNATVPLQQCAAAAAAAAQAPAADAATPTGPTHTDASTTSGPDVLATAAPPETTGATSPQEAEASDADHETGPPAAAAPAAPSHPSKHESTEQHPANSSALSVSPSDPAQAPNEPQNPPPTHPNRPRISVPPSAASPSLPSSDPPTVPSTAPSPAPAATDAQQKLACASVACTEGVTTPYTPGGVDTPTPRHGQAAVFDSDAPPHSPSTVASPATSPSLRSPDPGRDPAAEPAASTSATTPPPTDPIHPTENTERPSEQAASTAVEHLVGGVFDEIRHTQTSTNTEAAQLTDASSPATGGTAPLYTRDPLGEATSSIHQTLEPVESKECREFRESTSPQKAASSSPQSMFMGEAVTPGAMSLSKGSLTSAMHSASIHSASSPSPLQSRASSSRTPEAILLNAANLADAVGSATPLSAPSESGTEGVSTTGTPSEYPPSEGGTGPDGSPILQAHQEQAALLKLHMMGKKKKKFKAGSYVIGDDGSVTRGKRPPAR